MFRTKRFHLKLIPDLKQQSTTYMLNTFSVKFDENRGFGFLNTEALDGGVSSTLVYRSIVQRTIYNPDHNILESQEIEVFRYVPFQIDAELGLLQSELGGRKLRKLISQLGKLFNFKLSVNDFYINIGEFVKELNRSSLVYDVTRLTIANFVPRIGVSGRFTASVHEQAAAHDLIEAHSLDITNIRIELVSHGSKAEWRLSSSGSIAVRAEQEALDDWMSLAREVAWRSRDA